MITKRIELNVMQTKFSPFFPNVIAIGGSENFGLAGNSAVFLFQFDLTSQQVTPINNFKVDNAIYGMGFSEQNKEIIVITTGNGFFKMINSQTGQQIVNIKIHQKIVNSMQSNFHLPFLYLTSGDDGIINLIDISKQKIDKVDILPKTKAVNCLAWDPKNKSSFTAAGSDGELAMYDLSSSQKRNVLFNQQDPILSIDYNKYAPEIVIGSADGSLKIFDLRNTNIPAVVLSGHRYGVNKVIFSPFEKENLASCSYDMTVKYWSLKNMENPLIKSFSQHREFVQDIDFSMFQKDVLISGSLDQTFSLYTPSVIFNQLIVQKFKL